jgi:hypothetical protein
MKKLLILITLFSSLVAYSQMMHLKIVNNSVYEFRGKIVAGDHTGTNCSLTVTSFDPYLIKISPGNDAEYEDFKGQYNTSNSPVAKWEVNDGVNPPSILNYDDADLSYIYPVTTKWAFLDFRMVDLNTGTSVFNGQIQDPNYSCSTYPSTINSVINADWNFIIDPNTGNTLCIVTIN